MTDYTEHTWVDAQDAEFDADTDPSINAANLNEMEAGIDTAHSELATHIADEVKHITADQNAAIDGAATPSAENVLATMDDVQEGIAVTVTNVNVATYDLLVTDDILNVTYTATAAVTSLTLPTAQCIVGRMIIIKDAGYLAGTNNITIDTEGAEKVNNADAYAITGDGDSVDVYSDGTNWHVK